MPNLTATYTSPTQSQPFTHPLPALSPPAAAAAKEVQQSTQDRTAYLSALQTSIKTLQSDINVFLTDRMSEDKLAAAGTGAAAGVKRGREGDEGDDGMEDMDGEYGG